jgi:Fe2+ or Zn2+ uptake regulation protein
MLNIVDRENLRKRVKNLTPQIKNSEIVKHFSKEGISRRTVYSVLNKLQTEHSLKDKKKPANLLLGHLKRRQS